MRGILAAGLLAMTLARPAFAQVTGTGLQDPRDSDQAVATTEPVDRYSTGSGSYADLGRVRPTTAEFGADNPYSQTIGSTIGGSIGSTIGPR